MSYPKTHFCEPLNFAQNQWPKSAAKMENCCVPMPRLSGVEQRGKALRAWRERGGIFARNSREVPARFRRLKLCLGKMSDRILAHSINCDRCVHRVSPKAGTDTFYG